MNFETHTGCFLCVEIKITEISAAWIQGVRSEGLFFKGGGFSEVPSVTRSAVEDQRREALEPEGCNRLLLLFTSLHLSCQECMRTRKVERDRDIEPFMCRVNREREKRGQVKNSPLIFKHFTLCHGNGSRPAGRCRSTFIIEIKQLLLKHLNFLFGSSGNAMNLTRHL